MLKFSSVSVSLVKTYENCKLEAYQDTGGVWTIGYGHTGKFVHAGLEISQLQAEAYLTQDMFEAWHCLSVTPNADALNQNQVDALTDFIFNEGGEHWLGSTLRKYIVDGNYLAASGEFGKWIYGHVNGELEVLEGLVRRRQAEHDLFVKG